MISVDHFIRQFSSVFAEQANFQPWDITGNLIGILNDRLSRLDRNFNVRDGIAIHRTATVENGVTLKAPVLIGANCFVGANAYLRGGVYLADAVTIGPGCEIKTSVIFPNTTVAHFNFIGDSLIGAYVNIEAGAVTANHYNERADQRIYVLYASKIIDTNTDKFGALIGDHSKIGANAVLSPGTLLAANSVVRRLALIDQLSTG